MGYLNFANPLQVNEKPEITLTLVDLSGSMDFTDLKPCRKDAAIKANEEIVRVKKQHYPNDKVGVIGFQSSAKLLLSPTCPSNIGNLKKTINNACLQGGTDFVEPLELAYSCFFGGTMAVSSNPVTKILSSLFLEPGIDKYISIKKITDETTRRIILLTDGDHLGAGDPTIISTRLKNAGIVIDCIGIGGSSKDVNEKLLKQIASKDEDGAPRYCFIGDTSSLIKKYKSIAHHIRPI